MQGRPVNAVKLPAKSLFLHKDLGADLPPAGREAISQLIFQFQCVSLHFSPCSGTVKMSAPAFLLLCHILDQTARVPPKLDKKDFFGYNHVVFLYE